MHPGAVRAHHAKLVPVEQEPGEWGVLAVVRPHPPEDRLVLCPCQGDIEQPQVFAALLDELVLLVDGETVAVVPDVDRAHVPVVPVVEDRHLDRRRIAAPHVGAEHDREFESLAPVDRDHLHRLGVRFETARPLLVLGVAFGVVDPSTQPAGHGRRAQALAHARLVEQLGDVAQVGHEALTGRTGEDASRHVVGAADLLVEGGDPPIAQQGRPSVERPMEVLPLRLRPRSPPARASSRRSSSRRPARLGHVRSAVRAPRATGARLEPARLRRPNQSRR